MAEVLIKNQESIDSSDVLETLGLEKGRYFVVSMHREENVDIPAKFAALTSALNSVAETYGYPLIFSTHPRTKNRIESEGIKLHELIRNLEPLGFFDYNKLQKEAYCVLSDSGTVPEEAAILNFPGVSLRDSTERPEALDGGAIVLGGNTPENVLGAIEIAVGTYDASRENPVRDYRDVNVSEKVVKIIQSYTGIVDKRVWGK
jgi:UDP-N-acetylglucosamine 2-epimerase (non-hydrolysing)